MAARHDWEKIQAEYEAGKSMCALSRQYGVDKAAISRRARSKGWTQDLSGAVNRLAEAKVNGLVNTVDLDFLAEAVDRAASAKAEVILRHKGEWRKHQALIDAALAACDLERAKLAKITAETLKIRQEGERRAWGIRDSVEEARKDVCVSFDLSRMSSAQIEEMVDAAYGTKERRSE